MALVWRRSLSSGCMLLVARGSEKFAGLMAMKEEGEAFNTSNGFGWLPEEAALSQGC